MKRAPRRLYAERCGGNPGTAHPVPPFPSLIMKRCLSVLLLSCTPTAVALAADAPPSVGPGRLAEALHRAAPGVDREVLAMATHAMACTRPAPPPPSLATDQAVPYPSIYHHGSARRQAPPSSGRVVSRASRPQRPAFASNVAPSLPPPPLPLQAAPASGVEFANVDGRMSRKAFLLLRSADGGKAEPSQLQGRNDRCQGVERSR